MRRDGVDPASPVRRSVCPRTWATRRRGWKWSAAAARGGRPPGRAAAAGRSSSCWRWPSCSRSSQVAAGTSTTRSSTTPDFEGDGTGAVVVQVHDGDTTSQIGAELARARRGGRAGVVHRGRGGQRPDPVGAARVLPDAAAHVGRVGRRPDAGPEVAGGAARDPRRCPARRHEGARRRRHARRAQPHRAGHLHDGRRRQEVRDGRRAAHRHGQDRPRRSSACPTGRSRTSRRPRRPDGSRGC